MPYVMVPVPEEHVEEVMQFILRAIARASIQPWDSDSIGRVYEEIDEASRSVLAFVARAVIDGVELSDADAARKIQLSVREVTGIMNELNTIARDAVRPVLITPRLASERLANGRIAEKRMFQMDRDIADLVSEAERAEVRDLAETLSTAAE